MLWWVPARHRPSVAEAEKRLAHLDARGPTPWAFTFRASFPAPDVAGTTAGDEAAHDTGFFCSV